jgi:Predicted transcriptional regulators
MSIDETTSEHLADLFRTLSDPTRLRIISALLEGEKNVQILAAEIEMSDSAVSHQLRGLRQSHLVRARKEGRQVFYRLDDEHVASLFRLGLEHACHE